MIDTAHVSPVVDRNTGFRVCEAYAVCVYVCWGKMLLKEKSKNLRKVGTGVIEGPRREGLLCSGNISSSTSPSCRRNQCFIIGLLEFSQSCLVIF